MSNDSSNEQGNDTAAGPAFQVGDRVRWQRGVYQLEGVVLGIDRDGWVGIRRDDGEMSNIYDNALTLIARATPAPVGYSSDDALYECPNMDCPMVTVTPLVRTSDGALCCPECKTELVQPATPAPTATPPALDTHTLALDFREDCSRCCGERGNGECPECDGDGFNIRTLRLSDEAVDRLAAELAKRLPGQPPALLQAIEGPLNMEQLGERISLAWHAIQNAQSLTTDQTESEVLDALDKIGDSLHALFIAVRALLTLTARQKG